MFAVTTLKHQGPCGYGVFARRDLEPGEAIFIETPTSREARCSWTKEEFEALPANIQARIHHFGFELPNCDVAVMSWISDYVTGKRDDIPWEDRPDNGEFFNHCCSPNAWWEDDFRLVARVAIPAGQEITYDYATEDMDVAEFNCACGADVCRSRVTGRDWARPDLWASYGTHWKSHILGCIRGLQCQQDADTADAPAPGSPLQLCSVPGDGVTPSAHTGNQAVIPPSALNWISDSTATASNAGGRNRHPGPGKGQGDGGTATTPMAAAGGGAAPGGGSDDGTSTEASSVAVDRDTDSGEASSVASSVGEAGDILMEA